MEIHTGSLWLDPNSQPWQPERGFHLFKRGRLLALPIYFQDEQRIRGLMFLLTIALRVFTLIEFVVRHQLADQQTSLAGLYDGNPKRTTNRPTAERLLRAFCGLSLYFHRDGSTEISPLNCLQQQVLKLMGNPYVCLHFALFSSGIISPISASSTLSSITELLSLTALWTADLATGSLK